MTIKARLPFLVLVLPLAFSYYDPTLSYDLSPRREFQQCRQSCREDERSRPQRQLCEQRCEEVLREREEERDQPETYERCEQHCERQATGQQQQLCRKRCEEHRRGHDNPRYPEEQLQQCQRRCQRKEREQGQRQQQCERQCQERYEEEQEEEREQQHRGRVSESSHDHPRQRFERCQEKCQRKEHDQRQQQQCQQQCRERYDEEQEREHQHQHRGNRESEDSREDPRQRLEQCEEKCQREERGQRHQQQCQKQCRERYEQEQEREHHQRGSREEESEQSQRNNPYYFHSRRFQSKFRSKQGHLRVLERFTERSQLLRGIENYRMTMLVARPQTFVLPQHCDGDTVLVVTRGKGTISLVRDNKRESHNIEFGDAMAIQAGTTVYLINNDENENIEVVKLVRPVNNPGNFQEFFSGGAENPQSYFSAFSSNLLEQVLGVSKDQIERVFGQQQSGERQRGEKQQQQQEGFIRRASREQLRALSQQASSSKREGGRDTNGPISLKNQKPLYCNNNGKFFEANPQQFKQLQDMDVFVNLVDINKESIMVPHYNSKATVMAIVVEGNGHFEMACPHISSQRQQRGEEEEEEEMGQYEKVRARISPGDVFVIPADHPVAIVSSQNQNLRIVGFGVNAQNNQRNFLAGKDNVMNQVETEAKELAFNVEGQEADRIFNNQKQSYFVPQHGQREEGSRRHPLNSILDFGAIF